jgi:hypothetical protein
MALENEGFIELYDLTSKMVVSKVPLTHLRFIPRAGERVLISPTGAGDWRSYKVLDVEYFLNYDPLRNVPQTPSEAGKITLYVEASTRISN